MKKYPSGPFGLSTALLGAAAGVSWGALALGAAADPEVNDSSVRTLMYVDTYAFSALPMTSGLLVLSASVVIYRTSVLWRWLALTRRVTGNATTGHSVPW